MDKKIIVIGAGAAGIAAATKLVSNGFRNVTILEAENRVGGRVHTIPFGANVVDMGAQWCMGEKGNVIYELASDKSLLERSVDVLGYYKIIRSDGQVIPSELSTKLVDLAMEIYGDEKYHQEKRMYHGSFGNFFAEKYKMALKSNAQFNGVDDELAHGTYDSFHRFFSTSDACDSWYDLSCFNRFEECDGDDLLSWKDKGYITVFDLLQNKMPGSLQPPIDIIPLIKFNKTVGKINYGETNGEIKVECEDGSVFSVDHVICTVSLGVLKERVFSLFEPQLPLSKFIAIDALGFGTLDKIYLTYETPFWDAEWGGFTISWKLEHLKELREDPINGEWLEGLVGFYTFNKHQPNMLECWISGPMAMKMEQIDDAHVKIGAEKVLRMCLNQKNIPDAMSMIRSKWHSNSHFNGSYSYYSLKSDALDVTAEKLAAPIVNGMGKPIIQFAGEATNQKHYACVHGAIETGWREADRLIELYK